MTVSRSDRRIPGLMFLGLGFVMGAVLTSSRSAPMQASGGDRAGQSILTSGPVLIQFDEGNKVPIAQDALYYLDYQRGKLIGTIPAFHQVIGAKKPGENQYISKFAERDLVADFKLNLDNDGPKPRFLMTTGLLGVYSGGWAPLYVFETTTGQLAVYRIQQQSIGTNITPQFELLQMRSYVAGDLPAGKS